MGHFFTHALWIRTVSLGEFLRNPAIFLHSELVREATCPVIPKTGAEKLRRNQMIHLEGPWETIDWKDLAGAKELVQTVSKNLIL